MSIIQSVLLGILQGIAEFLPISSSGHLQVCQNIFGLEDIPLLYDVFLHLSTLLAVIVFFRKKILNLICTFGKLFVKKSPSLEPNEIEERKYILAIILTTFVTACIGLVTSKMIKDIPIKITCAGFIITALLLTISSRIEKKRACNEKDNTDEEKSPSIKQSLIIGIAQGIGTLPGISRSGSTISGALLCGVKRNVAGEFSFIASLPAILGAFILEFKDMDKISENIGTIQLLSGCASSFVAGYLSLVLLMKLIKKGNLKWFALYLIPAGILGIIFLK